jgi:23S rRNA pseudouridine1911/1915/1917 synthase
MPESRIEFTVETAGERLDRLIVAHLNTLSRSQVQMLIKGGFVTVDGVPAKASTRVRGGETVNVFVPEPPKDTIEAEPIALTIVYEDDDLAVIDKPAGLVVHPGTSNQSGTLVNAILARWPQVAEMRAKAVRRGIVHRLDKETSGLIVVALNDRASANLMEQFSARTVEKIYIALLERVPRTRSGRVDAPIGRDPNQRKRMAVIRNGRPAVTEFMVLDDNFRDGQALVEFRLLTGRTHQIRVHAAFIGCPIVGDKVYGFRKQRIGLKRHFLHAKRLVFDHPTTGKRLEFESKLPAGLQNTLDKLRP